VQLNEEQCRVLWGTLKGKRYSTQYGSDMLKPKARIGEWEEHSSRQRKLLCERSRENVPKNTLNKNYIASKLV